jgi:ADP-heptose:LPS heptosyltransferase
VVVWMCVAGYAAAVARACPHVDRVVVKGAAGWEEEAAGCEVAVFAFPDREVVAALRRRVPVRVGTGRRWHMVGAMTHRVWEGRKRSGHHEAWHGLRLLEPVRLVPGMARPGRRLPEDEPAALQPLVRLEARTAPPAGLLDAAGKPVVVVHPGSHGSANNWAWPRYADLVRRLGPTHHVVITGTAAEGKALAPFWGLLEGTSYVDATGRCSLDELIGLLSAADSVVAASTGPLHLAAALGTRSIGLFGTEAPVWPARWRPIGPEVVVMTAERLAADGGLDIPVDEVWSATQAK